MNPRALSYGPFRAGGCVILSRAGDVPILGLAFIPWCCVGCHSQAVGLGWDGTGLRPAGTGGNVESKPCSPGVGQDAWGDGNDSDEAYLKQGAVFKADESRD